MRVIWAEENVSPRNIAALSGGSFIEIGRLEEAKYKAVFCFFEYLSFGMPNARVWITAPTSTPEPYAPFDKKRKHSLEHALETSLCILKSRTRRGKVAEWTMVGMEEKNL